MDMAGSAHTTRYHDLTAVLLDIALFERWRRRVRGAKPRAVFFCMTVHRAIQICTAETPRQLRFQRGGERVDSRVKATRAETSRLVKSSLKTPWRVVGLYARKLSCSDNWSAPNMGPNDSSDLLSSLSLLSYRTWLGCLLSYKERPAPDPNDHVCVYF